MFQSVLKKMDDEYLDAVTDGNFSFVLAKKILSVFYIVCKVLSKLCSYLVYAEIHADQ